MNLETERLLADYSAFATQIANGTLTLAEAAEIAKRLKDWHCAIAQEDEVQS